MIQAFIFGYLLAGALAVEKRTCKHKDKVYMEDDRFMDGCKLCFCKENGMVACTNIMCRPHWQQYNIQMKASKGTCEFKGKIYKERDRFVHDCKLCFCGANSSVGCTVSNIMCKSILNDEFSAVKYPKPGKDVKNACTLNGKVYMHGAYFKNDCNQCFCGFNGHIGCTQMLCNGQPHPINKETCEHKRKLYKKGDRFMDGCNICLCGGYDIVGCTKRACN